MKLWIWVVIVILVAVAAAWGTTYYMSKNAVVAAKPATPATAA